MKPQFLILTLLATLAISSARAETQQSAQAGVRNTVFSRVGGGDGVRGRDGGGDGVRGLRTDATYIGAIEKRAANSVAGFDNCVKTECGVIVCEESAARDRLRALPNAPENQKQADEIQQKIDRRECRIEREHNGDSAGRAKHLVCESSN